MNKAAIYLRCSTDQQQTTIQKNDLIRYANARDFTVVEIFEDRGISGAKKSRPALNKMLLMGRQRKFDFILIWRLDRLGRSTSHLLSLLEEFETIGISLISIQEGFDLSTYMGKAMATIISALCAFERELLRERVKAGLENAKRNGKILGRPKSIDPNAIRKLRSQGLSYREISMKLKVSHGSISHVLKAVK